MLDWMSSAISSYGYIALFIGAVVEGPMAAVVGAFLASQGLLKAGDVFAVAVAADLVGDLLLYGLGRSERTRSWFQRSRFGAGQRHRFAALQKSFHARPGSILVIAKLTHAAGFLVLLGAGAARIPVGPFLGFNLIATLPKVALFVVLGYFAGAAYHRIDFYLWLFSCGAFLAIAACVFVYVRRLIKIVPPER